MADDPTNDDNAPKPTDSGGRLDPVRLVAEHGTADAAVRALAYKLNDVERDNADIRAKLREAKTLIPGDDALILKGEAKANLETLLATLAEAGLDTSDKLTARIAQADADAAKVATADRRAEYARVAEAVGANADALAAVFADGEEFRIEGEGEARKVFVIPRTVGDAKPEEAELGAYVDEHKAALKPALFATAQAPATVPGVRFVDQPAGGTPPGPKAPDAARYAAEKAASNDYARF